VTDDAFYAESPAWTTQMSGLGLLNVEMESSALFVIARQRRLRAAMICAVSSNLVAGQSVYAEDAHARLAIGWRASIETALETAARLSL
jgi:uridine phosphorylase